MANENQLCPLEQMDDAMRTKWSAARAKARRARKQRVRAHCRPASGSSPTPGTHLPQRRARPSIKDLPGVRVALGGMRVLRQPALDQGRERGPAGDSLRRPDQLREIGHYDERQKARSPMRGHRLALDTTTRSGSACIGISTKPSWSSWLRDRPYLRPAELLRCSYRAHQVMPGTGVDGAGVETRKRWPRQGVADYWARKPEQRSEDRLTPVDQGAAHAQ